MEEVHLLEFIQEDLAACIPELERLRCDLPGGASLSIRAMDSTAEGCRAMADFLGMVEPIRTLFIARQRRLAKDNISRLLLLVFQFSLKVPGRF
jgi:hypothetical protein